MKLRHVLSQAIGVKKVTQKLLKIFFSNLGTHLQYLLQILFPVFSERQNLLRDVDKLWLGSVDVCC